MGSAARDTQRLFVAIDPPEEAVTHLGVVVDTLAVSRLNEPGRSTRLAPRDRWHITLAFLGDVPTRRIDRVSDALAAGAAAGKGPGQLRFAGGGTFGRANFTILWAGLGGDVPGLRRLAHAVRRELGRARVSYDQKSFKPHLTLSRPGSRVSAELIAEDVAILAAYEGPLWSVEQVHLVASELGPNPRHTRIVSVPVDTP